MTKPKKMHLAESATLERIRDGLRTLRLPLVLESLDSQLAAPSQDQTRLEWLWRLLEPQVTGRLQGRIERRIRESRLPARKTFESFDFAFQPDLDRDLILELASLHFLDQGRNVLLAGRSGTGKSHIAMALGLNACVANRSVRYTTSSDMLTTLTASLADKTLPKALQPYVRCELLIIDEVGLEQVERETAKRCGLFQKVLLPRHSAPKSTIITSNIAWEGWGDYLDDHLGAAAIIDRLIQHSHVIALNGPSFREHVHELEIAGRASH